MPTLGKELPLDPDILGVGSAVSIAVDVPASAELATAIAKNDPFPPGTIELGHITVGATTGKGLAFKSGDTTVSFKSSAEIQSGIGVFDSAVDSVASLKLQSANDVDLSISSPSNGR